MFSYLCLLLKTGDKHWQRGEIDNPVSARQDTETEGSGDSGQRKLSLLLGEVSQNILILPEDGGVTRLIRCDSVTRNTLHVGTLAGLVCDQRRIGDSDSSHQTSSCSPPWCCSAWSSSWPCLSTRWSDWIPSDTCPTPYTCTPWPRVTGTPWHSRVPSAQRYEMNRVDLVCFTFFSLLSPGRWNYPYLTNIGNFSQNIS